MSKNCCNFARFFIYARLRKPYLYAYTRVRKEEGDEKINNKLYKQ